MLGGEVGGRETEILACGRREGGTARLSILYTTLPQNN